MHDVMMGPGCAGGHRHHPGVDRPVPGGEAGGFSRPLRTLGSSRPRQILPFSAAHSRRKVAAVVQRTRLSLTSNMAPFQSA